MVNAQESIDKALKMLNINRETRKIILKEEQETAVKELLSGNDVLAILPTGFGKSMIYTIFALARQELRSATTYVLIISPLKSLIEDQIAEMASLNCTALELTSDNADLLINAPPQFLYCTAEKMLEKSFLNGLKAKTALYEAMSAIAVL